MLAFPAPTSRASWRSAVLGSPFFRRPLRYIKPYSLRVKGDTDQNQSHLLVPLLPACSQACIRVPWVSGQLNCPLLPPSILRHFARRPAASVARRRRSSG